MHDTLVGDASADGAHDSAGGGHGSGASPARGRTRRGTAAPAVILRAEGVAVLAAAAVLYAQLDVSWWWFVALFLAPDLGLAGYAFGVRAGAHLYNLTHTLVVPLLLGAAGVLTASPGVIAAALIWAAHIGFDRALGYGLKYTTHFRDTHLQRVA